MGEAVRSAHVTMTGNEMSLEEYQAKAMLLGMLYDPRDHTFTADFPHLGGVCCMNPDTMEELPNTQGEFVKRVDLVHERKIGPKWLHELGFEKRADLWHAANGR